MFWKMDRGRRVRVLIYMKDGPDSSSSYYRIVQYVPGIERSGDVQVVIRALVPDAIWRARYNSVGSSRGRLTKLATQISYVLSGLVRGIWFMSVDAVRRPDCVIVVRSLYPKTFLPPVSWLYAALLNVCQNSIWDFDDDIFASGEISDGERDLLLDRVRRVVVTHDGLDSLLSGRHQNVQRMPTTDGDFVSSDLRRTGDERREALAGELRLVWVGSSSGLADIESVADALDAAALAVRQKHRKTVTLEIVCNRPFRRRLAHLDVTNTTWTRAAAVSAINRAHVGLMPLRDDAFARGKGGFKLVQYMASGLPVVASRVGFNTTVVEDGVTGFLIDEGADEGWTSALIEVADLDRWSQLCGAAIKRWESEFSFERTEAFWSEVVHISR